MSADRDPTQTLARRKTTIPCRSRQVWTAYRAKSRPAGLGTETSPAVAAPSQPIRACSVERNCGRAALMRRSAMPSRRRWREILFWTLTPWGPFAIALLWLWTVPRLGYSLACTGRPAACNMPLSDLALVITLLYSAIWPLLLALWLMVLFCRVLSARRNKVRKPA
jgi:hypothetical protein